MFIHCSNSSSNIPAVAHRNTRNSNGCHSERDCHRSTTTQLWNADMSMYQTILRLLSSAAMASTWWRVRELYCPTTYMYFIIVILNKHWWST